MRAIPVKYGRISTEIIKYIPPPHKSRMYKIIISYIYGMCKLGLILFFLLELKVLHFEKKNFQFVW